jgi:hypothetical protein
MWVITGTGNIVTVRPAVVVARVDRGRGVWTRGVRPAVVGEEDEHALLFRGARARAGVALDHSLSRQEVLDLLTELGDIIVLLEPIGALLAKAEALEAETDTGLATALCVWPFVAFLATDPTSIAARLGAHRAFCFGRSGFLSLLLLWWSGGDGSPRGGGRIMHCSGGE